MNDLSSPFASRDAQNNIINNPDIPTSEKFSDPIEEQKHRKKRLVVSLKLFSSFGFDEGVAGHITVRDPVDPESFWVNPFGIHFSEVGITDLI